MSYTVVKNQRPATTFPSIAEYFPNLEAWSVGFDREWRLLEQMQNTLLGGTSSYPPYNIKQLSEDRYKIEMAVAGFSKSELKVEMHNNQLSIEGSKGLNDGSIEEDYIYHGIAGRQFRQTFALADHVKVVGSELRDGILTIELERDLPEEKKPRVIQIN
jgi:molecular chaperone IbpA